MTATNTDPAAGPAQPGLAAADQPQPHPQPDTTAADAPPLAPEEYAPAIARPEPTAPVRAPWGHANTLSFLVIAVLSLVTKLVLLTKAAPSGTPVFDEKHYVPQGYDMLASWINPLLGGIESNPGFGLVVHPPLGKQLLALGEIPFGYTPLGWRIMTLLFGTATILFAMDMARRLTNSWQISTFTGLILTFDGVMFTASRFGMLDIFQVAFIVMAAWALTADYLQQEDRLFRAWQRAGGLQDYGALGPRLGFRWWRFTAGVALGCALSVKWSGLYYMAFFGILTVTLDALLRRRYGVQRWFVGMLVRDAFPAFASLVIWPVALYFWAWRAWFASETSVYRHSLVDGTIEDSSWLQNLPDWLAGFFHYHASVLEFHSSLTTSGGHEHPWESKPWAWLAAVRPILYYSDTDLTCGDEECRRMIFLFGTPIIWWLTVPVLLWAVWFAVTRKQLVLAIPLVAWAAGFLPWVIAYDRQMYFFYAVALVPFTAILLSVFLGHVMGKGQEVKIWKHTLPAGSLAAAVYLGLVVAAFIYWSPILYGYTITDDHYYSIMWLPSWI